MAGSNAAFDPDAFRTAIRDAMTMGLPTAVEDRATFVWDTIRTFDKADAGGNPFNWTATPEEETTLMMFRFRWNSKMAGTNPAFDASGFREAIRAAMTMGLPTAVEDRATFVWDDIRTFEKADAGGNPFDWTATPTDSTTFDDVQVPVAIEFKDADGLNTPVGEFQPVRATLTLLDVDYAQIVVDGVTANKVIIGGDTYTVEYVEIIGLFDVTVYQVFVKAVDES